MKRPYNSLAATHYFVQSIERKHTLTHPMQMDDVCFFELSSACDVDAHVGDISLPKPRATESTTRKDGKTFQELGKLVAHLANCDGIRLFVAYHHLCFHTIFVESIHESTGSNGSSSTKFTCAYEQNVHLYASFPIHLLMRLRMEVNIKRKFP